MKRNRIVTLLHCIPELEFSRAIERLGLPQVPVEAVVDAPQEITGRIHEAGSGNRPRGHAAHERVSRCQLLSVLAVEGGPCWTPAVEWNLDPNCHVLGQYQRPEGEGMWADRCEQYTWNLE